MVIFTIIIVVVILFFFVKKIIDAMWDKKIRMENAEASRKYMEEKQKREERMVPKLPSGRTQEQILSDILIGDAVRVNRLKDFSLANYQIQHALMDEYPLFHRWEYTNEAIGYVFNEGLSSATVRVFLLNGKWEERVAKFSGGKFMGLEPVDIGPAATKITEERIEEADNQQAVDSADEEVIVPVGDEIVPDAETETSSESEDTDEELDSEPVDLPIFNNADEGEWQMLRTDNAWIGNYVLPTKEIIMKCYTASDEPLRVYKILKGGRQLEMQVTDELREDIEDAIEEARNNMF